MALLPGQEPSISDKAADRPASAEPTSRRIQLLEHLVDIIAESGIEGVSVRTLAARAEVAIGTVQYHFSTKADLLLAAWEHIRDEAAEGVPQPAALEPVEWLRALAHFLVPRTADDRLSLVWLAFAGYAAHNAAIGEAYRVQWQRVEGALVAALRGACPDRPADEIADTAAELLALADGLALAVMVEPGRMTADRAHRICDNRLDMLLGVNRPA